MRTIEHRSHHTELGTVHGDFSETQTWIGQLDFELGSYEADSFFPFLITASPNNKKG